MATDTRETAEQFATELRQRYPGADIRVIDDSRVQAFHPALIAREGWEIIEVRPAPLWPIARMPKFDVVEIVRCERCQGEVQSIAFGEVSTHYCADCRATLIREREAEHARLAEESRREVEFAERYMRDGGRGWGAD